MPNTIADNLQILVNAKTDIKNAIVTMGGTVGEDDGLEDYVNDILTIPTGGGDGIKVCIPNISRSASGGNTMSVNTTDLLLCNMINMSDYTKELASAGAYLDWSANLIADLSRNVLGVASVYITCGFRNGTNTLLSNYYYRTIPKNDSTYLIHDKLNYQTQITGGGSLELTCSATVTAYQFTRSSISLSNISCKLVIPN